MQGLPALLLFAVDLYQPDAGPSGLRICPSASDRGSPLKIITNAAPPMIRQDERDPYDE